MAYRNQDNKETRRLVLAIAGTLGIIVFLILFGFKILVGFSLFLDKLRGAAPAAPVKTLLFSPVLDPLPEATNSGELSISGRGQANLTLILYLNESEAKKLTIPPDGNFKTNLLARDGTNIISAKLLDDQGNLSDLSNVITVAVKNKPPLLELATPEPNSTVTGEKNTIVVSGRSDSENTVIINNRLVVIRADGTFGHTLSLNEGENTIKVIATDPAGNSLTLERKVTYRRE